MPVVQRHVFQAKEAEKVRERVEKKKSPKPVRKLFFRDRGIGASQVRKLASEPERVKHTSPKHLPKKSSTPGKKGFSKASK